MRIQIYSYFHIPFGSIPQVSVAWIDVLSRAGHDVKVEDYFYQDYRFESVKKYLGKHQKNHRTVGIYFGSPSYQRNVGCLASQNTYKVGVFVTETELAAKEKEWIRRSTWSRIAVPSNYCREIFKKEINSGEVLVVPHGINREMFVEGEDVPKREKFTFLFCFNTSLTGGSLIRKNLGNLLSAFGSFRKKQDCQLLVKCTSNIEADVRVIEQNNPGVKFDFNIYTPRELGKYYKSCHAYVNPSRAEGFGMTVIEAMAAGIPVASPNHSGLSDFVFPYNAVVIPSARSTERFTYATNDGFLWDVPAQDIENAMARLYSENEVLSRKAKEYAPIVRSQYSWDNCLKGVLEWLRTLT